MSFQKKAMPELVKEKSNIERAAEQEKEKMAPSDQLVLPSKTVSVSYTHLTLPTKVTV